MISSKDIYDKLEKSTKLPKSSIVFTDIYDVASFSTAGIDETILHSLLFKEVSFESLSFYSNDFDSAVSFKECVFARFEIAACEFNDLLLFENCSFDARVKLVDSVFKGPVKFHNCDFHGGINLFDKHDSFGSVEFLGGLYVF